MAERVSTSYHKPSSKILKSWSGGVYTPNADNGNPFDVTSNNPNTANGGNPYPPNWATCRGGIDGNTTIALTGGFTPSVNLVVWEWNNSAKVWFQVGSAAAAYKLAFDATYTQGTFKSSENSYYLIQSDSAITQNAWTDGMIDDPRKGGGLSG